MICEELSSSVLLIVCVTFDWRSIKYRTSHYRVYSRYKWFTHVCASPCGSFKRGSLLMAFICLHCSVFKGHRVVLRRRVYLIRIHAACQAVFLSFFKLICPLDTLHSGIFVCPHLTAIEVYHLLPSLSSTFFEELLKQKKTIANTLTHSKKTQKNRTCTSCLFILSHVRNSCLYIVPPLIHICQEMMGLFCLTQTETGLSSQPGVTRGQRALL